MKYALILIAALCVVWLAGCGQGLPVPIPGLSSAKASDEDQIVSVLDSVARGMEMRKVSRVMAHVSRNYHDADGRDYEAIRQYLTRIMKGYRVIRITRTRPRVIVEGERARAMETFGTVAEPFNEGGETSMNLQGQVEVLLERENNTWQIVEWGSVL